MKKQKQKIKNTDENIPAVNFLGRNFAGGNSPGGGEGSLIAGIFQGGSFPDIAGGSHSDKFLEISVPKM